MTEGDTQSGEKVPPRVTRIHGSGPEVGTERLTQSGEVSTYFPKTEETCLFLSQSSKAMD